ncbi:MAG: MAPEG family protein, partial [Polyangiaceae bacterium]
IALGPRDEQPPLSAVAGRAQRALTNMQEALPVFLTLAILHVVLRTPGELPTRGAALFLGSRAVYVPAYLAGIIGLRSTVWAVSWVGLGMMIAALLSA